MKLLANKQIWNNAIEFLLIDGNSVGKIEFNETDEGCFVEPSFVLDATNVQNLMDQLWNCGIRPSEGSGSVGALKAVELHLADMRRLVFNKNE